MILPWPTLWRSPTQRVPRRRVPRRGVRLRLEWLERRLAPAGHDTLDTALGLTLGAAAQVQASGTLTDPNQADLYVVQLKAGDQVAADVQGQGLAACLRFFDGSGQPLAFAENAGTGPDTTLTFDALRAGSYYVGVSSNGDYGYDPTQSGSGTGGLTSGAYDLRLNRSSILIAENAGNTSRAAAQAITGSTGDGSIDGDMVLAGSYAAGATEYYSFGISQTGELTATLTTSDATGVQPRLSLYGAAGQLLIQSDGTGATDAAQLSQSVEPGSYYLGVSGLGSSSSGHYLLATRCVSAAGPPFQPLPVGFDPQGIAVSDFNHDSHADVVTADYYAADSQQNDITVLLGNGDGTFQAQDYSVSDASSHGVGPVAVAVADLNNDGNQDIVTADFSDSRVSVLLGNGDGTFQNPVTYPVGSHPTAVALGNFNGVPCIVTANAGDTTTGANPSITVLLGNGDGTFRLPAQEYDIGTIPQSVAVGNFNGRPGIVTADLDANAVTVLLGNGDGTFGAPTNYAVGVRPFAVAVGDFNGVPDIVTADSTSNTVSVLLGKGNGTFATAVAYPVGLNPGAVTVGDCNGVPDIVVANYSSNSVSVLLGNGDGTFQSAVNYPVDYKPWGVALGAFAGSGNLDIAVSNSADNTVSLLPGRGDGTFLPPAATAVGQTPLDVAVGDFNHDGNLDVVTANSADNTVSVLLGNGDGTFQPAVAYPVGSNPFAVAVADLNNDGNLDIVVADADANTVSVLLGRGDGTFLPAKAYSVGTYPEGVAVATIDGHVDIVTADSGANTVSVLVGYGDGTFQAAAAYRVGTAPTDVAVGDIGGRTGIVTTDSGSNTVSVLASNGDGTFAAAVAYPVGNDPFAVALGQAQGRPLIVATERNFDPVAGGDLTGDVAVLWGDGAGGFNSAVSYPVGTRPDDVVLGSFTTAGAVDIAVVNAKDNTISVLLGNPDGSFAPAIAVNAGDNPVALADGDFNNDGNGDLVAVDRGSNTLTMLLGSGRGAFQSSLPYTVDSHPVAVAVGYDNANNDVVATANKANGSVSVLVGDANAVHFNQAQRYILGATPVAVAISNAADNVNTAVDIATVNTNGTASLLLGNDSNVFPVIQTLDVSADPLNAHPVGVALPTDSNSDLDIITANAGDGGFVSVLRGDDNNNFSAPALFPLGHIPVAVAAGNDADYSFDIIATANRDGTVSVLVGQDDDNLAFGQPVTFTLGRIPVAIAVGNDADNRLVIVTANADNTVSVLHGDSAGHFTLTGTYAVGSGPVSVAVGNDTNYNVDIVTANATDSTVTLLQGDQTGGSFLPAVPFKLAQPPSAVAVGNDNTNGNGNLDIFAATAADSSVTVLRGDLQFHEATAANGIATHDVPQRADLNGDGIPDELTIDAGGHLLYRQGLPNGAFAPAQVINPGTDHLVRDATVFQTAIGPAVAAVDDVGDRVSIYAWNAATRSFKRGEGFVTGGLPVRIAAADLDGRQFDGRPLDDLVVANDLDGTVTIAFQTSAGKFTTVLTRAVGAGPSDIAFANLGGQQGPDIVVSGQVSGDFTILFNDAGHTFGETQESRYRAGTGLFDIATDPNTQQQTVLSQLQTVGIASADFTATGRTDLIALNPGARGFTRFIDQGAGVFSVAQSLTTQYATAAQAMQIVPVTLPPDLHPSLAVLMQNLGQIWIFRNRGDGTFAPPSTADGTIIPAGNDPTGMSVAYINNRLALLVGNGYGDVLTLLFDGHSLFAPDRSNLLSAPMTVGKLAGSDEAYVVVANQNLDQMTTYLHMPGSNQLISPTVLPGAGQLLQAPGAVTPFFVTGNPEPYLAVANSLGNSILLYHGTGNGQFDLVGDPIPVGFNPVAITAADINGDGVPDLLVANHGSNDISVLIGTNDGGTWTSTAYQRLQSTGSGPIAVAVRDSGTARGDDLLVTNSDGSVTLLPGIGTGGTGSGFFQNNNAQTFSAGVPIDQATETAAGNPLMIGADGSVRELLGQTFTTLVDGGVSAVDPFGDELVAGLDNGAIELLSGDGTLVDDPVRTGFDEGISALQVLQDGSTLDVFATAPGSGPIVVPLASPLTPGAGSGGPGDTGGLATSGPAIAQAVRTPAAGVPLLVAALIPGGLQAQPTPAAGSDTSAEGSSSSGSATLTPNDELIATVAHLPPGESPPAPRMPLGVLEALQQWPQIPPAAGSGDSIREQLWDSPRRQPAPGRAPGAVVPSAPLPDADATPAPPGESEQPTVEAAPVIAGDVGALPPATPDEQPHALASLSVGLLLYWLAGERRSWAAIPGSGGSGGIPHIPGRSWPWSFPRPSGKYRISSGKGGDNNDTDFDAG